jgi:hypothetical protein
MECLSQPQYHSKQSNDDTEQQRDKMCTDFEPHVKSKKGGVPISGPFLNSDFRGSSSCANLGFFGFPFSCRQQRPYQVSWLAVAESMSRKLHRRERKCEFFAGGVQEGSLVQGSKHENLHGAGNPTKFFSCGPLELMSLTEPAECQVKLMASWPFAAEKSCVG